MVQCPNVSIFNLIDSNSKNKEQEIKERKYATEKSELISFSELESFIGRSLINHGRDQVDKAITDLMVKVYLM